MVRPGRRGIALSIDPNSDDKIYEINAIKDSLEDVIKLTGAKTGSTGQVKQTKEDQKEKDAQPKKDDRVLVPDIISEQMAKEYIKEEGLDNDDEPSDAETISSTSTADFDREEAEDLLDKISSCQTALSQHYNRLNQIVPHMTNAKLANYMGKIHIMPLVKAESGPVSKTYTSEPETLETKFIVCGETQEEKLQGLVNTVPTHQLMLAIAIGDIHLNKLSYDQASQKYQISKSRIQRAISGKAEHKKGGKQYELEKKQRKDATPTPAAKAKKAKIEKEQEQEEETPQLALFPEQVQQDILPDLVEDDEDDQFPEINIDA